MFGDYTKADKYLTGQLVDASWSMDITLIGIDRIPFGAPVAQDAHDIHCCVVFNSFTKGNRGRFLGFAMRDAVMTNTNYVVDAYKDRDRVKILTQGRIAIPVPTSVVSITMGDPAYIDADGEILTDPTQGLNAFKIGKFLKSGNQQEMTILELKINEGTILTNDNTTNRRKRKT